MPPAANAYPHARLAWADVAKGACIVLVVLHHAVTKQYDVLVPAHLATLAEAWTSVTHALKPVRMPLFFVLSGLFAAGAVRRPWPQVTRRIASPAYLYVVWLLLLTVFLSWERELPMNRTQNLTELAQDLVFASTGLWFLYALAVYFVLVRALDWVPTWVLLAGAGALAATASLLPIEEANRVSVLVHFVFFAVGVRCPVAVHRVAGWTRAGVLPLLTVALVMASTLVAWLAVPLSVEIVMLSMVGVPWGMLLAVRVARASRTGRSLARIGRRTLPVYVLHIPVLGLVHHLGLSPAIGPDVLALSWAALYPLLVTALVVAACLTVHAGLLRLGLGFLFALPNGWGVRRARADRPELERVTV